MERVAEGLTGQQGVNFFLLPRKAFIFAPSSGATSMFQTVRGFCVHKLDAMEPVVVRLASFATNTSGTGIAPISRLPEPSELRGAAKEETVVFNILLHDREELADEILTLASEAEGLLFFLSSKQADVVKDGDRPFDNFWKVEESTREVFSRLAAIEAMAAIDKIDAGPKVLYTKPMTVFFRMASSAGELAACLWSGKSVAVLRLPNLRFFCVGACAMWFNGSFWDILVAGVLGILVGQVGTWQILLTQELVIYEVVASFIVGLSAGLIALRWPDDTCFGAMAIAGVLDILQGFRVVYAIIEVMSKNTISGAADLLEGLLFTGLIAMFLTFGQSVAAVIYRKDPIEITTPCTNGVNELWYILFVPLAAISWSGLFMPEYRDIPVMGMHGVLAYAVSYGIAKANLDDNLNNFLAALSVTLSAGIISRFTGRQAVGNTVAGLYVLLPGAYMVTGIFGSDSTELFVGIIQRSVFIGIGAWSGTILCSPTLLGATRGLLESASIRSRLARRSGSEHGERERVKKTNAMLFF
jgi:uncharacterized membrane protein YjjB (DUF3815 family)